MRGFTQKQNQAQKGNSITPAMSQKVVPQQSMNPRPIVQLQRTIGNHAVLKLLQLQTQEAGNSPAVGPTEKAGLPADDDIKEEYFSIVAKGSSHYIEAIQYLIDTFKIDASHAALSYDPSITGAYAITGGDVGDEIVPIRFGPLCFDKSEDFGVISRAVAHEIIHSKQKSVDLMSDHNEREFLAYYDTITRTDMVEITDLVTFKFFIKKALGYYEKLSTDKQKIYADKKQAIIRVGFSKLEAGERK